jgi:hypothetical protein
VKPKESKPRLSATGGKKLGKVKDAKVGDKRQLDLSTLDDAHYQEMADSARRQDTQLALEAKRTELQLEREKNKRRKLELETEKMRREDEDRKERLRRDDERDKRFYCMMENMVGMGGTGLNFNNMPGGHRWLRRMRTIRVRTRNTVILICSIILELIRILLVIFK